MARHGCRIHLPYGRGSVVFGRLGRARGPVQLRLFRGSPEGEGFVGWAGEEGFAIFSGPPGG